MQVSTSFAEHRRHLWLFPRLYARWQGSGRGRLAALLVLHACDVCLNDQANGGQHPDIM